MAGASHNVVGQVLAGGLTPGDWLDFAAGLVVGGLGAATTLAVAWRQRVNTVRDRAAQAVVEAQRVEAQRQQQARLDRRDAWRAEYDETRDLLKLGEDIAYQVANRGPLTSADLDALGLPQVRKNAEHLALRGVTGMEEPLTRIAELAHHLAGTAGSEADCAGTREDLRAAIRQDRVATALRAGIVAGWQRLREEWGG